MALLASYNVDIRLRPSDAALPEDDQPKPLSLSRLNEILEEAVRREYWDAEPGGQSVDVHVTSSQRTDK